MSKSLLEIFEEYFYPQINIDGDDINANIERYKTCYNLLHWLLCDLDEMGEQTGSSSRLPERWKDNLEEYFNDCMTKYIMNSDYKSDLSDENTEKYIPYEYTYCSQCKIRCYYNAYPQAIVVDDDGNCLCEFCMEAINSEGEKAEKQYLRSVGKEVPKKVKIKIIRK